MLPKLPAHERRLNAARLVGANAFALIAQLVVHMPAGYFGASDELTYLGKLYAIFLLITTVVGILGQVREWIWTTRLIPLTLAINIGLFVAPMMASPIVSGMAILWNLVGLLGYVFPREVASMTVRQTLSRRYLGDQASVDWLELNGPALLHLLLSSLILTTTVVGYEFSGQLLAMVATLTLNIIALGLSVPMMWGLFRQGYRIAIAVILPILVMVFFLGSPAIVLLLLALYQGIALAVLVSQSPFAADIFDYFVGYPALLLLVAFAGLSLLGTLLLSFPAASASGVAVSALDAFFTATSAACITGLSVLDISKDFSIFGHVVILILIQLGGMGIMSISTFAMLVLGSRLGLRAEKALEQVLDQRGSKNTYRLTSFIVVSTLSIELVGAVVLSYCFRMQGDTWPTAIWHGVFHAVSAFCQAGFALQTESLMMFQNSPLALMTFSGLIMFGSLGFIVLATMWSWSRGELRKPGLHAQVVLIATAAFVVVGTVLFLVTEWNASLANLPAIDRVANAIFQSVSLRSAGLSSVDMSQVRPASTLFMMFFMFIGGSPGSTSGGIKVTTFVILISSIRGIAAGHARVVLFRHQIPQDIVYRAAAVTIMSIMLGLTLLFVLLLTQTLPFEMLAFEAISALGTVGLSLGATPQLNAFGKLAIILVIFIGRVGPLALVLTLRKEKPAKIGYPQARILIG